MIWLKQPCFSLDTGRIISYLSGCRLYLIMLVFCSQALTGQRREVSVQLSTDQTPAVGQLSLSSSSSPQPLQAASLSLSNFHIHSHS